MVTSCGSVLCAHASSDDSPFLVLSQDENVMIEVKA
jgi:hypothetical protein